jgi:hypothetical protein
MPLGRARLGSHGDMSVLLDPSEMEAKLTFLLVTRVVRIKMPL